MARLLSKHEGDLSLGGLKTLSDGAAEWLSKHKGRLYVRSLKNCSETVTHHLANYFDEFFEW